MNFDWKNFYDRMYNWMVQHGPGILMAIILFIAGILLIRLLNKWVKKAMDRKRVNPSIRYFLLNLFAIILQVLLVVLCLQVAGFQLTLFSAILAGLTVAAGLALSGTLQNFVSGILILFLKPYRVGDTINTQGQEGTVTSIQLFYTVILTYDNKTIIVPNGQLSNSVVINLSKEGKRRLDIDLRFHYKIDMEHAKAIIAASLKEAPSVLDLPAPRIGVSLLDNDMYTLTINAWTQAHGFIDTRMVLLEKLATDLRKGGALLPGME